MNFVFIKLDDPDSEKIGCFYPGSFMPSTSLKDVKSDHCIPATASDAKKTVI